MKTRELQRLVQSFRNDGRPLLDSDEDARALIEDCTKLFSSSLQLNNLSFQDVDAALFNASFDIHHALYRYDIPELFGGTLLDAIEFLFDDYYASHETTISCQQFWDNALGYSVTDVMPPSGFVFLERAVDLLSRLLTRPEVHIRASALHGLNHHPIVEEAKAVIERHVDREADPSLRDYASRVLNAFAEGRTLV